MACSADGIGSALTLVVMTRNRADEVLATLDRLRQLPERPPLIVVDNGSTDGTAARITGRFPDVDVVRLTSNAGAVARNIAVQRATTPYVALNDDDSWWAPGALTAVVDLFERHAELGAITGRIVVEPGGREDAVSSQMRHSPLPPDPSLPGIPVLGFLACATAVRRTAFLQVGGFHPGLHFWGEEDLFATDLARHGWQIRFVPEITVHHQPSASRNTAWRQRRGVRNKLWTLWLRRPAGYALRRSWWLLRHTQPQAAMVGLAQALCGLRWVLRDRDVVPQQIEHQLRLLELSRDRAHAHQYLT
jgi:GT2 family glycosyltransferase